MPQSIDKLNQVLKRLTNNTRNDKRTIPLPYHPNAPHQNKQKQNVGLLQPINSGAPMTWQLNWMLEYDQSRQESAKLKEQMELLKNVQSDLTKQLLERNKKISQLLSEIEKFKKNEKMMKKKRNKQMKWWLKRLTRDVVTDNVIEDLAMDTEDFEMAQTMTTEYSDQSTQTENNQNEMCDENPVDEHSDQIDVNSQMEIANEFEISDEVVQNTAKNSENTKQPGKKIGKQSHVKNAAYECDDCGFTTNKKSTLDDHQAEYCVNEPIKDSNCPICGKSFTRRSLRVHINGLIRSISKGRKLRGAHETYDLKHHQDILNDIKIQ